MGWWNDLLNGTKESYKDASADRAYATQQFWEKAGDKTVNVGENVGKAAGSMSVGKAVSGSWKGAKFAAKGAGLLGLGVAAVGGLAWWADSKRSEAARESRQALRDQEMAALNAQMQTQTMAQPAPQMVTMDESMLGKPTLMGEIPREGNHVAALGRGGKSPIEFSQPTPDIGRNALPA